MCLWKYLTFVSQYIITICPSLYIWHGPVWWCQNGSMDIIFFRKFLKNLQLENSCDMPQSLFDFSKVFLLCSFYVSILKKKFSFFACNSPKLSVKACLRNNIYLNIQYTLWFPLIRTHALSSFKLSFFCKATYYSHLYIIIRLTMTRSKMSKLIDGLWFSAKFPICEVSLSTKERTHVKIIICLYFFLK